MHELELNTHACGNILDVVWIIFARDGSVKYFGLNHNTKDDFKDSLSEMARLVYGGKVC